MGKWENSVVLYGVYVYIYIKDDIFLRVTLISI